MVKPQDKEMKMQWITVDGRRTPIILPQIWDHEKEDWVVTSTENPLPTQVTGSIVEQFPLIENKVLTANTTKRMQILFTNVDSFIFTVRKHSGSKNFNVKYMFRFGMPGTYGSPAMHKEMRLFDNTIRGFISEKLDALNYRMEVSIENPEEEDIIVSGGFSLYGGGGMNAEEID